jgi:hypothetical protein
MSVCPCACYVVCHLFICAYSASECNHFSFLCFTCQFLYFSYIFTMERVIFSSASLPSVAFKTPVCFVHGRDYNL